MDIKYNVTKFKENKKEEIKDHISVEEPLEMNLRFKKNGNWHTENLSITMRTPGNDEDLILGFLFNERVIENINQIKQMFQSICQYFQVFEIHFGQYVNMFMTLT